MEEGYEGRDRLLITLAFVVQKQIAFNVCVLIIFEKLIVRDIWSQYKQLENERTLVGGTITGLNSSKV